MRPGCIQGLLVAILVVAAMAVVGLLFAGTVF